MSRFDAAVYFCCIRINFGIVLLPDIMANPGTVSTQGGKRAFHPHLAIPPHGDEGRRASRVRPMNRAGAGAEPDSSGAQDSAAIHGGVDARHRLRPVDATRRVTPSPMHPYAKIITNE